MPLKRPLEFYSEALAGVSRDELMEGLYNRKATPFDRSIDMHISHLRKKLERGDSIIKTIRGVGYQLARTPEDAAAE